ncbi:FkbM family methyltransferase [Pectinatus frisingensis]|uniref:FkbM family methyltransferase n=1 Tax=Pectinatus frisingensis TaxID=865 RepID=UPI0018C74480|nr:FkbM family methyltransferase [Pectinatus frisingensis]
MKKDIILWGIGEDGQRLLQTWYWLVTKEYNIIGLVDSNPSLWGKTFMGFTISYPDIKKLHCATILITSKKYTDEIRHILINNFFIERNNILLWKNVEDMLVRELGYIYRNTIDSEIKQVLNNYNDNGFNIYGTFYGNKALKPIQRDEDGWPYTDFEDKKMYFPKNYKFIQKNGKEWVRNLLYEQGDGSPHLYLRNEEEIPNGAVIVDAGTCEGNFALRFIERARKIYLIESDPVWMTALKKTFEPYSKKVIFCNKFLSRFESSETVTLDGLVKEKIDFLKMDIEGEEINALLGGRYLLRESDVHCSICSYHRNHDDENIQFILNALGYQTSTSQGYMFFVYDPYIASTMDFRRGIVYATKNE